MVHNVYLELMVAFWLLSVVKAWVGEMTRAPSVSTETIAHSTMSCDCGSTRGTVICFTFDC